MNNNDRSLRNWALVCCLAWPAFASAQAAPAPTTSKPANPRAASGAVAAGTTSAAPAAVDTAPSPAALAAAQELMGLQEDTVILNAQLKKLDVQTQVAERQEALSKMGRAVTNDEVAVIATQGLGHTMMATLNVNNSSEVDVHAGDTLSNGMRVVSIRPGIVVIDSHGMRNTLTVSSSGTQSNMVATGGMRNGMSPIPTIPMPGR
ncbi:type IV pilus biogenesis protein PilP [Paraburkholderia megapolitana]|uniref:type IV pilus biogenesis protein PilP n=1 Tax=Paraburkholderia megapolitana TaxID=420953 RepID=UPI0038BE024A